MDIHLSPRRLVFVILVHVLFVSLLLVQCAGCVSLARPGFKVTLPRTRDDATVAIFVECRSPTNEILQWWHGSGVVVDPRHVLTALHVVDCSKAKGVTNQGVYLTLLNGKTIEAKVESVDLHADVARVAILSPAPLLGPGVRLGRPPKVGDMVCVSPGWPKRECSCGFVARLSRAAFGDLYTTAYTTFGNSGSAVYDRRGHLVGIITNLWTTADVRALLGGRATTLEERRWILQPE